MNRAPSPAQSAGRDAAAFFGLGISAPTPESVAARIRAAVDLGVLSDGQALLKEADLAARMKVTGFTLREALAQLRAEGLVVTKVGRGGGSFIRRAPEEAGTAARDLLASMSSVALRDLGDWRSMIAAESADLASHRASAANIARLRTFAEQVRSGDRVVAGRASARFRVELAASAQSLRMSVADVTLHEEFGSLFAMPLEIPKFRSETATSLRRIVDAISQRDGATARAAAAAESHHTIDALLRTRLRLIGSRASGEPEPGDQLEMLGDVAWGLVAEVREAVSRLALEVHDALRGLLAAPAAGDDDLDELYASATRLLSMSGRHVQGMGVMFDPGALPHHPFGGAWMTRRNGDVVRTPHVADPHREDFYDYSMAEWMTEPRASETSAVVGPYVDYGGVNDYILTVAVPVRVDGVFIGVAAADVRLADYEIAIAPALGAVDRACCLANAEGRIILSNSVAFAPGALLPVGGRRRRRPCGDAGWSIVYSGR